MLEGLIKAGVAFPGMMAPNMQVKQEEEVSFHMQICFMPKQILIMVQSQAQAAGKCQEEQYVWRCKAQPSNVLLFINLSSKDLRANTAVISYTVTFYHCSQGNNSGTVTEAKEEGVINDDEEDDEEEEEEIDDDEQPILENTAQAK